MRTRAWAGSAIVALGALGCCAPPPPCHDPGCIGRVAGTGAQGFNGDGRPGAETNLYLASAVRAGPDGRVYLMDFNNHRLRVIDFDGRVRTVAGSGVHAGALAGIPAVDSPLENPVDFGFLSDGTIVFVSFHDPRVLAVGADGVLTVVAGDGTAGDAGDGGPALAAQFLELVGIAVAPDDSIFVADDLAHRVRVIRPSGLVEAYAGTGVAGYAGDGGPALSALLRLPAGLALDGAGNLYVAEAGNHVVRRVLLDGTIETLAGTGIRGSEGDGGPATAARFAAPEGVAVDASGTVYVSDTNNHRVRRIDPQGTVAAVAGTGAAGLAGDGGPAIEARLNGPARLEVFRRQLLFADQRNNCARVVYLP